MTKENRSTLEASQAGLSCEMVFRKKVIIEKCFGNFMIKKVEAYTEASIKI
ncbi:DNA-3-methyladenine glycosylase I [Pedobacter sp. R-06]|uniref:DNA-3-methyladenine glycosylase I n=1 Tax=Pedobacter sp. R-06 TaxID=3404051 RepID=UPI003CED0F18